MKNVKDFYLIDTSVQPVTLCSRGVSELQWKESVIVSIRVMHL